VIRQRLSRYLTSSYSSTIGKGGDKKCIHGGVRLAFIEHFRNALVDKRNGSNLYTDHPFLLCRISRNTRIGQRRCD
jgi:hypothetical protein